MILHVTSIILSEVLNYPSVMSSQSQYHDQQDIPPLDVSMVTELCVCCPDG